LYYTIDVFSMYSNPIQLSVQLVTRVDILCLTRNDNMHMRRVHQSRFYLAVAWDTVRYSRLCTTDTCALIIRAVRVCCHYTSKLSFRTRLLQHHKRIKLRQPALTEDLFREPLRTLARTVTHGQGLCGREFEGLGEAFSKLLFGGSVKTCNKI